MNGAVEEVRAGAAWRLWWTVRRAVRRLAAIALWFAGLSLIWYALHAGVRLGGGPSRNAYFDPALVWQHYGVGPAFGALGAWLVVLGVVGQLARLVDYRWFDVLCLFVPFYNFWWSARLAWRLTYKLAPVPVRDWPPASERESSWLDQIGRRLRARVA